MCVCVQVLVCVHLKSVCVCLCSTFLNWKLKMDQYAYMNATQSRIFYCLWHVLLIVWAFFRISKRADFGCSVPAHCCVLAHWCRPEEVLLLYLRRLNAVNLSSVMQIHGRWGIFQKVLLLWVSFCEESTITATGTFLGKVPVCLVSLPCLKNNKYVFFVQENTGCSEGRGKRQVSPFGCRQRFVSKFILAGIALTQGATGNRSNLFPIFIPDR